MWLNTEYCLLTVLLHPTYLYQFAIFNNHPDLRTMMYRRWICCYLLSPSPASSSLPCITLGFLLNSLEHRVWGFMLGVSSWKTIFFLFTWTGPFPLNHVTLALPVLGCVVVVVFFFFFFLGAWGPSYNLTLSQKHPHHTLSLLYIFMSLWSL